jgi:hypothetical protein
MPMLRTGVDFLEERLELCRGEAREYIVDYFFYVMLERY